jgi:hypothetical protein
MTAMGQCQISIRVTFPHNTPKYIAGYRYVVRLHVSLVYL